jgi:hypothetical protein
MLWDIYTCLAGVSVASTSNRSIVFYMLIFVFKICCYNIMFANTYTLFVGVVPSNYAFHFIN